MCVCPLPSKGTLFRFEATSVRVGAYVERDMKVVIVADEAPFTVRMCTEDDGVTHSKPRRQFPQAKVRLPDPCACVCWHWGSPWDRVRA